GGGPEHPRDPALEPRPAPARVVRGAAVGALLRRVAALLLPAASTGRRRAAAGGFGDRAVRGRPPDARLRHAPLRLRRSSGPRGDGLRGDRERVAGRGARVTAAGGGRRLP